MRSDLRVESPAWIVSVSTKQGDYKGDRNEYHAGKRGMEEIGEVIATRRLYFSDETGNQRTVSVLIGAPQQSKDSHDFYCPFQVVGIGTPRTQVARGHDSIQALQSALILIAANLNHLNYELGGRLTWDQGRPGELGFP